jgi:formamidopyrimidine-DNA glycosylase
MPELPEVETTLRGLLPHLYQQKLVAFRGFHTHLRWPIPKNSIHTLENHRVENLYRRAKYLILDFGHRGVLVHLGMSGSLRIETPTTPKRKHDHWEMEFSNGIVIRYHDPRRFGALLWWKNTPEQHPLLARLGLEPLDSEFSGHWLFTHSRKKSRSIKSLMMDSHIVVGIGNIYANEALFCAGIRPDSSAGKISLKRYIRLCTCIKTLLGQAIEQGGTTLRDFINGHGQPGYFQQTLKVYGKENHPCPVCQHPIQRTQTGQRSSWHCPVCQKR